MSHRTKVLMDELLTLPATTRQNIVKKLIKSLSSENDDSAFNDELDRRWEEVASGKVKPQHRSVLDKRK